MRKFWYTALSVSLLALLNIALFAQQAEMVTADVKSFDRASTKVEEPVVEKDVGLGIFSDGLITVASYPFSVGSGSLVDMTAGTTLLVPALSDDGNSALINIGFDFWYDGVRFTQFGANANGFIRLGLAPTGGSFNNATGFAVVTNAPKIAPYYDDLCVGGDGQVRSKVVGTAPNRTLVVEWFNMKVTRNATCTAAVGNGTFQLWLNETAGSMDFVYGAMPAAAAADAGYTIGLQSGAATNFASVTSSTASVSYAVHNSTQLDAITAGTKFSFIPLPPLAPTTLNTSAVTAVSMTLSWTDNSANEIGFALYRSTNGTDYSFVTQTAADVTSFADSGLTPETNYFYRVYAVGDGALSPAPASASQTTNPLGVINATAGGGLWSSPATWVGGVVPNAGDSVTIPDGATVTIDTAASAYELTVGTTAPPRGAPAILQFEDATARTLTVTFHVTINSAGTLRSSSSGTQTGHVLSVGGNLTNNGTLDFSTNVDTAGAGIVFTGASNAVFGGSGAVTDIRTINVNKGTNFQSLVELTATNFTVLGSSSDNVGFLTLTNGAFGLGGTFSGTNRVFTTAGYTIPATAGFWMNNPNYTVAGQNGSPTSAGAFRVSQGTYNIGTSTGNSMGFSANSTILVEGGAINSTGRFGVAAAANAVSFNQTGGTITVNTIGHTSTTLAGFDMGTSALSSVLISGGSIVVQNASTAATGPRDYRLQSGSATTSNGISGVTGGTLQLGNASTAAVQAFSIQGVVSNLTLTNNGGANTAIWGAAAVWNNISRNITIETGTTMNFGGVFLMNGATLTNNGTLTHNIATSRFIWFLADLPQTLTGSGTFTAPMTSFEVQNGGVTINSTNPIVVARVILFVGGITNTNNLTLGNGGAAVTNVQFGNTTTPTDAGVLDVAPAFNLGTGGLNISYLRGVDSRSIGPEIPPTRTVNNVTHDDNDPAHTLTLAGGDLTVGGTLALTNGPIATGANTLIHTGTTVTRTAGLVNGKLRRNFTAPGAYTFHVGRSGYSPVLANATAVVSPSGLTVEAFDTIAAGFDPAKSIDRFWSLTEAGDITADLSFTYPVADVNGIEADYRVWRGTTNLCAGGPCVNTGTHVAGPVTGVTDFSNWTVAESSALAAVSATISGRIVDQNGRGIHNMVVTLIEQNLNRRIVRTSSFGYYSFTDVQTLQTVTVSPSAKRFVFTPSIFVLNGDATVNFTGTPTP